MSRNISRKYHITLDFYSDSSLTNFFGSFSTKDNPSLFTVNGQSVSSDGVELTGQDNDQDVVFTLPEFANPAFFNRVLYVSLSATLSEIGSDDLSADTVFIVDESGSMSTEHEWIGELVTQMDQQFQENNITDNRYAICGFGSSAHESNELGHQHTFANNEVWTDASGISNHIDNGGLSLTGGTEDGLQAIEHTIQSYDIRENAVPNFVLITDERRDNQTGVSTPEMRRKIEYELRNFCFNDGILSCVVSLSFYVDETDEQALGLRHDYATYLEEPNGGFSIGGDGYIDFSQGIPNEGDAEDVWNAYGKLAFDLNGSIWDLALLSDGGNVVESYSNAFISERVESIFNADVNLSVLNAKNQPAKFYCERDVTGAEKDPNWREIDSSPDDGSTSAINEDLIGGSSKDLTSAQSGAPSVDVFISKPDLPNNAYHFRAKFYSDEDRTSLVHSGFSLLDPRLWYYIDEDDITRPFDAKGLLIESTDNTTIRYAPDILPPQLIAHQNKFNNHNLANNRTLICGITYYVDIESYDGQDFVLEDQFQFRMPCRRFWRPDDFHDAWISSANGKQDIRLSRTVNQALCPTVTANSSGHTLFSWQDLRNSEKTASRHSYYPQVYYSLYDPIRDIYWSSGQGYFDQRALTNGFDPVSITDNNHKFYITAHTRDNIYSYNCDISSSGVSENDCFLSDNHFDVDDIFDNSEQYLNARVMSNDMERTFVDSSGDVLPVINDCLTRLDIIGVPGVYAVRARNEIDADWTDWIAIDSRMASDSVDTDYLGMQKDDGTYLPRAYSLDNVRFILPWVVSPGNGFKRVCFQVLTVYGISRTFCLDLMLNARDLTYKVELFSDSNMTESIPTYNGYPVVTSQTSDSDTRDIYVKVTFQDPIAFDRAKFVSESILGKTFSPTFNVIQQGINDQYYISLSESSNSSRVFTGSFSITESDGVFNKDGIAAVTVNVQSPCYELYEVSCSGSGSDKYNEINPEHLSDNQARYHEYVGDVSPSNVLSSYKKNGVYQVVDIQSFKQSFNTDNPNFMFGEPEIYKKR